MKYIKFPVILTSIFLMVYAFLPPLGIPFPVIFLFFILMNFLYFWMIYMILKHGQPSGRTFRDHWYDDVDMPRNNPD
jgi:hypothetical protein